MVDLMWRHRKHKNFVFSTNDNDVLSTYFSRKLGMFDFLAPATYDYVMAQSDLLPHGIAFFLESRKQSRKYLQEMMETAKKENFYIVILCDEKDTWLEKQADTYVIIKKTEQGGANFYTAKVLMWIEILLSAYAARCKEEREL